MRQAKSLNAQMSDRLYSGEVRDFGDAMRLVMNGMAAEAAEEAQWNAGLGPDEQDLRWKSAEYFQHYRAAAKLAFEIHREEQEAAKARTLARLRERCAQVELTTGRPDSDLLKIIAALESGDYTELAW